MSGDYFLKITFNNNLHSLALSEKIVLPVTNWQELITRRLMQLFFPDGLL